MNRRDVRRAERVERNYWAVWEWDWKKGQRGERKGWAPSGLVGFNSTFDVDKQLQQHKSFQNPSTKHVSSRESSPPSSALVLPTRPLSLAAKAPKIHFAQLTSDDMHVYPSAPSSLKRKALALMLSPVGEEWVISLGEYKSHTTNNQSDIVEGYYRMNPKHDILWSQVEA